MQRFFETVIEPVFEKENIRTIVEIGADKGGNTAKLIGYANTCKGKVYSVDPVPGFDSDEWERENPDSFVMIKDMSLNVIKNIKDAQCFLIDGDHNWYTVYNELVQIYEAYGEDNFPLIMFHDILWPYDRRDLYYSPETIPAIYRHEYEKKALAPGSEALVEDGINSYLFNAKKYGGEKNGVLTAVEDFVKEHPTLELGIYTIDVLHGLGMIASKKKYPKAIEHFYSSYALKSAMKLCESERLEKSVKINSLTKEIAKFTAPENELQIAKIYPDFGNGYSESTAFKTGEYSAESDSYYAELLFEQAPLFIRFDPVNASSCILENIIMTDEYGMIEPYSLNGTEYGDSYIFKNTDPQIIFKNDHRCRRFRIKANIFPFKSLSALTLIDELLSDNSSLSDDKCRLEKENAGLSDDMLRLEKENAGLSDDKCRLEKENISLSQDKLRLEKENTDLSRDKLRLNAENSCLSAIKRNLEAENKRKNDELSGMDRTLKNSAAQLDKLSHTADELKAVQSKLSDTSKKNNALNGELKNLRTSLANANARIENDSIIAQQLLGLQKETGWKYALKFVFKYGLFAARTNIRAIKEIRRNGGFDVISYCGRNKDVLAKGMDPLVHFMWFGGYEGRNPSNAFDVKKYLDNYADVKESGVNPYAHYVLMGRKEKRNSFPAVNVRPAVQIAPTASIASVPDTKARASAAMPAKPAAAENAKKALSPVPVTPKYSKEQIIDENRNILKNYSYSVEGSPLVSIIIINHNGLEHLKTLFGSFKARTFYRNFEMIIVDNASSDSSLEYIRSLMNDYKIRIIENKTNESFSKANNQAIAEASGEYVLFLNNDIEVTDHWLDVLLHTAQTKPDCGAVGARLIYPYVPVRCMNHSRSFTVQHLGIVYSDSSFEDQYFIRPVNFRNSHSPLLSELGCLEPFEISGVTAACMLVRRSVLDETGGFDEQYVYGYEDCDLNLSIFRKGYKNYVCPAALLFHYEFGTQASSEKTAIVERRTNNIHHFKDKWQNYLQQMIWTDKLNKTALFTDHPLTVAVVVTTDDPDTAAGDYFTGMELCTALQEMGYKTKFLSMQSPDRYNVGTDTDILISLLEKFDLNEMKNVSPALITIAWARNWFDRWSSLPYIQKYSYIFASSKTACNFMQNILHREVTLFPIATNENRFNNENTVRNENSRYSSDYVFTGSYWSAPREIIDLINPDQLPYKFKVFGANWDKVPKFAEYNGGFVNYSEIPEVYRDTRIVVDDANHVTKPYGAVNSRVFDALAAGRLVVTNGMIGAEETFEGLLPSFKSAEEFNSLISHYLSDEKAYNDKVRELREFVLKNHTYAKRAEQLIDFIRQQKLYDDKKIALMIPVPKYIEAESWGDYHFAVAMKKQFESNGFTAEIRILPEWDMPFDGKYVIVLRGLSIYRPKSEHINIMWNISHPDDIPLSEYEQYDKVYVSSEKWTEHLKKLLHTNVDVLMQCTDEEVFCPSQKNEHKHQLLFVGNSRKVFRKIIKDLLPTPYSLSVYGTNWENYIDASYIKGQNIPNKDLGREYGSCDILLNDHWDDMREKGFVSNRIFDGLASGAFIITDEIDDLDSELKECVAFYKDREDLAEKVSYFMEHPDERTAMAQKGMNIVRQKHTFRNRTEKIIEYILNRKD